MKSLWICLLAILFANCSSTQYCNTTIELGPSTVCVFIPPGFQSVVDSENNLALSIYHNYSASQHPGIGISVHTVWFSTRELDESSFDHYHGQHVKELAAMRTNFYSDTILRINGHKWAYSRYELMDTNYRSDAIFTIKNGAIYGVRVANDNYQPADSQKYQQYVDSILRSVVFRKRAGTI